MRMFVGILIVEFFVFPSLVFRINGALGYPVGMIAPTKLVALLSIIEPSEPSTIPSKFISVSILHPLLMQDFTVPAKLPYPLKAIQLNLHLQY